MESAIAPLDVREGALTLLAARVHAALKQRLVGTCTRDRTPVAPQVNGRDADVARASASRWLINMPIIRRRGTDEVEGDTQMTGRRVLPVSVARGAWAILAALASAACGVAACGVASFNTVPHTVTTTTQPGSPVTKVDVQNDNGDIEFRRGDRGTVTRTEAWISARPSYTQSLRSGTLTIRARCPRNVSDNQCSVKLVITVPPTVELNVTTTNGSIRAAGFQSEIIAANSTNGNVNVSLDAQPASMSLETTNGNIAATASGTVPAGQLNVTAKSTNGDVNVSVKQAPTMLSLATVNGVIQAMVPPGSYRLTTHTVFGSVSTRGLRNDLTASNAVTAQTVFGDITVSAG